MRQSRAHWATGRVALGAASEINRRHHLLPEHTLAARKQPRERNRWLAKRIGADTSTYRSMSAAGRFRLPPEVAARSAQIVELPADVRSQGRNEAV